MTTPSERSGAPPPLVRLADVLAEASGGVRPTPRELAELLWLAHHMEPTAESPAPEHLPGDGRDPGATAKPPQPPREQHQDGSSGASGPSGPTVPPAQASRVPLHLPASERAVDTAGAPHASLMAPAPPMLRHPLALQRALRPLKRHTDGPVGRELDERATADRIARLGADPEWWLPVLRPARERWLRLNLVHDAGPTMPVWRPLIHELHTALAQSGIFRTVTPYSAEPDGTVRPHGADAPADGRTVTLLISDCMGRQWRQGPAGARWYGTLRRWAHRMPLAVVQPLPEHLWRDTALPATPGRLSAPHPAAPSAALAFSPYDTTLPYEGEGAIALPVLEAGPEWLANWASLIADPGGGAFPASAALFTRPLPADSDERTDVARLSAEELVLRFRATASPEAFRLAGHLAVGRPDLPVMRLVQAALEPRPRPQHLAEVILSGMLTGVAGPPGSYAFRPGVRDLLLRSLPRTARSRTADLLSRIGALIDERAGAAAGEIPATTPLAAGRVTATESEPIATVTPRTRDRLVGVEPGRRPALGARYRFVERIGPSGSLWRAEDIERRRSVVVRLHSPGDPERLRSFLRAAEALAAVDHPNVVAVHDHGVEDDQPYVVMEHLDGISLNSLASPGGYRIPAPLLVSLGRQLAAALTAVHEAGVAHGALDMTKVVILPDGTAKLMLFDLGQASGGEAYWRDLRALGRLLFLLLSGSPPQAGTRISADRFAALPEVLRPPYVMVLRRLLAEDLLAQQEGVGLLQQPWLVHQAREAYAPLRYSFLGRPSVSRGPARPLAIGSPQEQAMLTMLLLHHGHRVTHTQLTEGIWGRKAPTRAAALLGTYASRLRNALGPGVLATLSDGYALHTSADFVDVIRCQQLVEQVEVDRAAGNVASARTAVNDALSLWRGTALADVPGPAARAARTRFLQLRLSLSTTRAELDLELGEFERAATDLADLVRSHPSREDFRRLHMIALHRQGHLAEAVEAYEEYRISGGSNPELLLLGEELREEYAETPEDGPNSPYEDSSDTGTPYGSVAAPDELPEGPFPTEDEQSTPLLSPPDDSPEESPLPQDDVPDDLFAPEDARFVDSDDPYGEHFETPEEFAPGYEDAFVDDDSHPVDEPPDYAALDDLFGYGGDQQPLRYRSCVFYDFVDGPGDADTRAALGRAVTRLLTASDLEAEEWQLLRREAGFTVLTAPGVSARSLLAVTLRQFQDVVVKLGGIRLRVVFGYGWNSGQDERPDGGAVLEALGSSEETRGIIAVAPSLRDELNETDESDRPDGKPGPASLLKPLGTDPADGWYRLCLLPRALYDGTHPVPAVLGPYPLPVGVALPPPLGRTRTMVYARPGGECSPTRTSDAEGYYEVDLTRRRTDLEENGPPLNGELSFTARGEAVWWVTDPVEAARGGEQDVPDLIRRHLRSRLRHLTYPPTRASQAQAVLDVILGHHVVPGYNVRWELYLGR